MSYSPELLKLIGKERLKSKLKLPAFYDYLSFRQRAEARLEYARRQKGLCYHCKGKLRDDPPAEILGKKLNRQHYPEEFFEHKLHLHHNHVTGLTIGVVHAYCNAVLWEYYRE